MSDKVRYVPVTDQDKMDNPKQNEVLINLDPKPQNDDKPAKQ